MNRDERRLPVRFVPRTRRLFVLPCLWVALAIAPPLAQPVPPTIVAQPTPPQAIVVPSTLPRLRRAWSVTGLTAIPWRDKETTPASDGALFVVNVSGARHLVALDFATGKERWRAPQSVNPEPQIEFATGMVLRNASTSGQTEALAIKTGKSLWTSKLCDFSSHPVDNGAVGFVMCHGPWNTKKYPDGTSSSRGTTILVAFDLTNGRELWRRDNWHGLDVVIGARQVFVRGKTNNLVGLDPRTGAELQEIATPPPGGWYLVAVELGGRPMMLLNGGGDGMRTNRLVALGFPGGGELWSRPYPQGRLQDVRGAVPHDGRLFEDGAQEVTEVDVTTGKVALDCPLPRVHDTENYAKRWRLMRGEVVSVMDGGHDKPLVVIRCGARPGKPTLAQLPRPAAANDWRLVAAEDGIVVMHAGDEMTGYRVFDTEPPEQVALSPIDRVRAILDRASSHPNYTLDTIANNRRVYDELRAVPDVGRHLMALVNEEQAARRDRAVDAATALRVPGVVDLLLGEIFRAPAAVPRKLPEAQVAALIGSVGPGDEVSNAYARALSRRSDQIVLLAAMDDTKAAARLAPLLMARSTPEGFGWRDWNIWDHWSMQWPAMKAWDGATLSERRARMQRGSSPDVGHSEVLTASQGRPESHAAVYRLLARLGRPEDAARLDELDRATARTGGWATICDADDAVKDPGPKRVWVDPWGVCNGINLGAYRVTQSRNVLWLRRRLADGSFGPPAWAADPGGDQCNGKRRMQKATMRAGRHVIVRGTHEHDHDVIIANIDAGAVFADSDRDGLTDKTEAAFGTDAKRADTDGDGVPDGRDPAPLAKPPADTRGEAEAEVVRFATVFLVGGPLTWLGDRATWGESASAAGVLLHLPQETDVDDQACYVERARDNGRGDADRPRGVRTPFPVARVRSLTITGDRAQGRFIWSTRGDHLARDLGLARVQGKWRVVDDRKVDNYP